MIAIVTVKLKRDSTHDPRNKIVGACPLGGRTSKCTDVTGSHHSYIEVGKDLDQIYALAKRKYGHVTRVEVLETDEVHDTMVRFRMAAEHFGEDVADLNYLLDQVEYVLEGMEEVNMDDHIVIADLIDWRQELRGILNRREVNNGI